MRQNHERYRLEAGEMVRDPQGDYCLLACGAPGCSCMDVLGKRVTRYDEQGRLDPEGKYAWRQNVLQASREIWLERAEYARRAAGPKSFRLRGWGCLGAIAFGAGIAFAVYLVIMVARYV